MRTRAFTYAAAAGVLGIALAACSGSHAEKSGTKVNDTPHAAGPAAMSCTGPDIPMAEWRKRCDTAAPTGTPGAGAAKTAGVGDTATLQGRDGTQFTATLVRLVDPAPPGNPASPWTAPQPGDRFVALQ